MDAGRFGRPADGDRPNSSEMIRRAAEEMATQTRRNLRKYCGLDTCAMVKLWEKPREAAE